MKEPSPTPASPPANPARATGDSSSGDPRESQVRDPLLSLSKEELVSLLDDYAKNWLTHDGLWFLEVEQRYGLEEAVDIDRETWRRFTVIEARRVMRHLGIPPNSGIAGLKRAFDGRMYTRLNRHEIVEETPTSLVLMMRECRIQTARLKKSLPYFPCGNVSIVQYSGFASTVDDRIKTSCVFCPPDSGPEGYICGWRFDLLEKDGDSPRT